MNDIICDFDDFSETRNRLDLLYEIKKAVPNFKVTLFTIMASSSVDFLKKIAKEDWIELAIHGYRHEYKECLKWDRNKIHHILTEAENMGCFVKGFKAPHWEVTQELYEVLYQRGYWIADHEKNRDKRPKRLTIYELQDGLSVHGHIQNVCGNGLEEKLEYYKSLRGSFHFINFWVKTQGRK